MPDQKDCNRVDSFWAWDGLLKPFFLLSGVMVSVLVACTPVGPDYLPPQPELPSSWQESSSNNMVSIGALEHWWTLFNDPLLDSLISRATESNYDLQIAVTRVVQARAQYQFASGLAMPTADISAGYTRARDKDGSKSLFQVGFDTVWELDVFGGARRAKESASATFEAANENSNDVLLSLQAEVARNYFELRSNQQRLKTAENSLAAQQKSLEVARGRQASGFGAGLDVAQSETQLALTKAQLPALMNGAGQAAYRLDLLLGLPPGTLSDELSERKDLAAPSAQLPDLLPSDLLRRRPDIRRSERQLAAATADVGVAVANLFPRFSLTGLIGLQSANFGDLLTSSSQYWAVGPSINWSLFNGGRVRAGIDFNKARRDEAQAVYEKSVLGALSEVESSLMALSREVEVHQSLTAATVAAQQALKLASGRYKAGLSSMLDLLVSERALYQSQDQLILSCQRLNMHLVALYKALGGGWQVPNSADAATGTGT